MLSEFVISDEWGTLFMCLWCHKRADYKNGSKFDWQHHRSRGICDECSRLMCNECEGTGSKDYSSRQNEPGPCCKCHGTGKIQR